MSDKVNILIVEDEAIVALALEDTLESEGYQVVGIADNGKEALDLLKKNEVDLMLLDIQIRGAWDGVETAKRLMALKNVPFIYLTAFSDEETVERAKETSPAAYLVKPFQPRNLLIAVDLALHNFADRHLHPSGTQPLHPGRQDAIPASMAGQKDSIVYFNDTVFIKQNYKYIKVYLRNIYLLEAEGNYTSITTKEAKYVLRNTLNAVLERLNFPYLIRVHRSYAINIQHVDTFNETSVFLIGREIPLSRSYKEGFLRHFDFL